MAKTMNIVVLGTRGFPSVQGGIEAHCEKLYPRLAKRECRITVFLENLISSHRINFIKVLN